MPLFKSEHTVLKCIATTLRVKMVCLSNGKGPKGLKQGLTYLNIAQRDPLAHLQRMYWREQDKRQADLLLLRTALTEDHKQGISFRGLSNSQLLRGTTLCTLQ